MRGAFVALVLGLACLHACGVQTEPERPAGGAPAEAGYQLVESLLKQPRLLEQPWTEMRKAFPNGCTKPHDSPEISCPPMPGVLRLAAEDSGSGIVDLQFADPITCDRLYAVISKQLGAGQLDGSNKCSARWRLPPPNKRAHVRVSRGKKDSGKIYFQLAMEQGP